MAFDIPHFKIRRQNILQLYFSRSIMLNMDVLQGMRPYGRILYRTRIFKRPNDLMLIKLSIFRKQKD